jgi:hypothetical protein
MTIGLIDRLGRLAEVVEMTVTVPITGRRTQP